MGILLPTQPPPYPLLSPTRDADLREDPDRQDHHPRGRELGHDREREAEDPGRGGHPSRPAAPHLRRQAARGRPYPRRLQHPEGIDSPPRPPSSWRRQEDQVLLRRVLQARRSHHGRLPLLSVAVLWLAPPPPGSRLPEHGLVPTGGLRSQQEQAHEREVRQPEGRWSVRALRRHVLSSSPPCTNVLICKHKPVNTVHISLKKK